MRHTGPNIRRHRAACVAIAAVLGWLGPSFVEAQTQGFTVTSHCSLQTFRAEEPPRGELATIRLSAARAETESFQLALVNRSSEALRDVRIVVSGLTGIEATVYAEAAVRVTKPGRSTGAQAGRYFDLLRPAGEEGVAPGEYRPYWIDLKVAPTAAAGPRDGRVSITTSAGTRTVPIHFQVYDFQLPEIPSLKLAFAFGLSWMEAYYGKPLTRQQLHAAQDVMLEHRLGPLPMWGSGAELFSDEARLRQCLARGLNVVLLTCSGETDEQIQRSLESLEPKVAMLRRLGALDRTYLFGYDEITATAPARIPAMRKAYEQFHSRHPEIRRINTSQPDPRIQGFVDIFVVPTSVFVLPMAADKETWWYSVGADNLPNEPDFRIDFPPVAQRGFFLADWKAGVQGHLYWAVQREWPANRDVRDKLHPEDEWHAAGYENLNSKAWVDGNGGGNLFYPDSAGGMLPTPRVKRIRDGIEDYEYLAQLKTVAAELARKGPQGGSKLLGAARDLLSVPDGLVRVGDGWREGWTAVEGSATACSATTHPAAIHGGRQALRVLPTPTGVRVVQDLPAAAGSGGVFSGWLKTNDLTGDACLTAEYLSAEGRSLVTVRSPDLRGSSRQFEKRELTLPPAPHGAKTLRLGLSARLATASTDPQAALPKAFFDDLALRVKERDVPLVNPGFEAERLRVNFDPDALTTYRQRVAECLEQCVRALR